MHLSEENYHEAFHCVDQLLSDHRAVWSESAFVKDELSWCCEYPILHRDLLSLSDEELVILSNEKELMSYLSSHIPKLGPIGDWQISIESKPLWETPRRALFGLPGRKKQQTEGFVTALLPLLKRLETEVVGEKNIVDWCSGLSPLVCSRGKNSPTGDPFLAISSSLS